MKARSLFIVPHPASGQPLIEVKLDDLIQLETGGALLLGWITFTSKAGIHKLIYNTRASRPLDNFLAIVKRRWLEKSPEKPKTPTRSYGDELDIKFNYSTRYELLEGETVLARYFQAPVSFERHFLFFKREEWHAGNLILWTSANRLVWITDNRAGQRELYASISFSVLCDALRSWRIEQSDGEYFLEIAFDLGVRWRMLIHQRSEEFCHDLNKIAESSAVCAHNRMLETRSRSNAGAG